MKEIELGHNITIISIFCISGMNDLFLGDHDICVLCVFSGIFLSVVPAYLHKSPQSLKQDWELY